MTEEDEKKIEEIERERRDDEDALLLLLLLYANRARLFIGHSVRDENGIPDLNFPGLSTAIQRSMASAYANGYLTGGDLAGVDLSDGKPAEETPEYKQALGRYWAAARQQASDTSDTFQALALAALTDAGPDAKPRDQVAAINDAFVKAGWSKIEPNTVDPDSTGEPGYAAQLVATMVVLNSYNPGLQDAYKLPAVRSKIKALSHITVDDGRETDICHDRIGLTLAPDDPYWTTGWPSLHFGCRSCVIPRTDDVELSQWRPTIPPDPGFGVRPF